VKNGLPRARTASHYQLRWNLAKPADKKTTATGGAVAVESERIAWGEMDAPWDLNVGNPKPLHMDRIKSHACYFGETPDRPRRVAAPPSGSKRERAVAHAAEPETL